MMEGNAPARDHLGQVLVVRDHHPGVRGTCHLPAHGKRVGEPFEFFAEATDAVREASKVKFNENKESSAKRIGGILLRRQDVSAAIEKKARYRGNDSRPIRASDQEASDVPARIIAPRLTGGTLQALLKRADT